MKWASLIKDPINRFNEKYIPEPNTGCWLWIGEYTGANKNKYPAMRINSIKTRMHRFSKEAKILHGENAYLNFKEEK